MSEHDAFGNLKRMDELVEASLKEKGLEEVLSLLRIRAAWEQIVGGPLFKKTRPVQLSQGELVIQVADAAYSQHLRYYEGHIKELVASPGICNANLVRRLRFQVGKLPPLAAIEPQAPKRAKALTEETWNQAQDTAKVIEDPWLRSRFARLMTKNHQRPPA